MVTGFGQIEAWLVALALAAVMLAAWGLGWRIGQRRPADPDEKPTSRFIDGSLAVFGLLLGFTFAVALEKHEQRRLLVINDSNSMADLYTCASLLKEPYRGRLRGTIREYVGVRVRLVTGSAEPGRVQQALAESERLQGRMTELVGEAVEAGTPVTVPLVNTLNNLTSSYATLLAAMRDRLPGEILFLLFAAAVISAVLVGRHHGERQRVRIVGTLSYVVLVALIVCVILDLNQPFKGMIRVSQEPLERVAAGLGEAAVAGEGK